MDIILHHTLRSRHHCGIDPPLRAQWVTHTRQHYV